VNEDANVSVACNCELGAVVTHESMGARRGGIEISDIAKETDVRCHCMGCATVTDSTYEGGMGGCE
jgi:hypothetical protein